MGYFYTFVENLNSLTEVIERTEMEDRLWIKICDSGQNQNVICCFAYIPPVNSVIICNEASQWSSLEREVAKYTTIGKVIICGDLNARLGNMLDFILSDSGVYKMKHVVVIIHQKVQ